ncbi:hypothetical protein [Candidatus Borreliella tachyglossi]|uniref:hypothetical protein n=1 Tax=Candidatus Borreliella tachyglossi TaxID=1964448 RepID=UPI0040435A8C
MGLRKTILLDCLLLVPNFLYPVVVLKEQFGMSSNFLYLFSDYDSRDFFGTGILKFENKFYFGASLNHDILQLSVAPSFVIKDDQKYLGFKNIFLNLYFDSLIVKLGKQNYYLGSGLTENIILGRIEESEEWFAEVNYFISNYTLSLGIILDKLGISELERPKYVSPWAYFQTSFPMWELLFMIESPLRLENNSIDVKFVFDAFFEIYNGVFLYSTIRQEVLHKKKYALIINLATI